MGVEDRGRSLAPRWTVLVVLPPARGCARVSRQMCCYSRQLGEEQNKDGGSPARQVPAVVEALSVCHSLFETPAKSVPSLWQMSGRTAVPHDVLGFRAIEELTHECRGGLSGDKAEIF